MHSINILIEYYVMSHGFKLILHPNSKKIILNWLIEYSIVGNQLISIVINYNNNNKYHKKRLQFKYKFECKSKIKICVPT